MGLMWYWECDALDMLFSAPRHAQYHADHHQLLNRNFAVAGLVTDYFIRSVAPDLRHVLPASWYHTKKTRATHNTHETTATDTTTTAHSETQEHTRTSQSHAQTQPQPRFAVTPRSSDADRARSHAA